jgi:hypothetical protein
MSPKIPRGGEGFDIWPMDYKRHLRLPTMLTYYRRSLVSAVRTRKPGECRKYTDNAPVEEVETGRWWVGQLRRQSRRKLTEQGRNRVKSQEKLESFHIKIMRMISRG